MVSVTKEWAWGVQARQGATFRARRNQRIFLRVTSMNTKPRNAVFSLFLLLMIFASQIPAWSDDASGADTPGPVSSSSVSIGGEQFAVDPRSGTFDYSFDFFKGNVNYGQTPFSLSLKYQQTATATYVGAFTDSDNHPHPYGVSAYLPTPLPNATENGTSQLNDAGAVWDLNLPALFISTSKVSKFYGKDMINATVVLSEASYQYTLPMPTTDQNNYATDYAAAFANNAKPLYSKDAIFLGLSQLPNTPDGAARIQVQDKHGVNYVFAFAVLYGYEGVNVYDPTYNSSNNAPADEVLVYRIQHIIYPNGQSVNFTYADDFGGNSEHVVSVWDGQGHQVAKVSANTGNATVAVANQQGSLQSLYGLNLTQGDYRVASIQNLSNSRTISFSYQTSQSVPYAWNNQTALTNISNGYTGASTSIGYQQFNANVYDAGCNKFLLGQLAVKSVNNNGPGASQLSAAQYDFGFSDTSKSNFIIPQQSGQKTYGSGLSHWLDNYFYRNNQDSSGCSASDTVFPSELTYTTQITTGYPDSNRDRLQSITYDALGRTLTDNIQPSGGPSQGKNATQTSYTYDDNFCQNPQGCVYTFEDWFPISYASPTATRSGVNICTLNGVILDGSDSFCYLTPTQSWVYDSAGNPTQETSPLGQLTEYTYLPASETQPQNERMPATIKTYSVGNSGKSFTLETLSYQNLSVAPAGSGALAQMTLPTSNVETRHDAASGKTYTYRTDSMGSYVTGNAYPLLNGILGQRQQIDDTKISDVQAVTTTYVPSMTSYEGQTALGMTSSVTGQSPNGAATRNRGGSLVNYMGYPLQTTDGLGRISTQAFDNYGRLVAETVMKGTAYEQTRSTAYDLANDLALNSSAKFSIRKTDAYGNQTVQLYDFRQRHIATYQTLAGQHQVLTESLVYDDPSNTLVKANSYGNGYTKSESYCYSPGTQIILASVPNAGLASGRIIDGLNGNTLEFSYQPGTAPCTIGKILGPAHIVHTDLLSNLVLTEGLIDAEAASTALAGFDLVTGANGASLSTAPSANLWFASTGKVPSPLLKLYQGISQHAASALTEADNLLEVKVHGYDEWNRRSSTTVYTFVSTGEAASPTTRLSVTTTKVTHDPSTRSRTITYPQGQQKTETFNLLSGLQNAKLTINGGNSYWTLGNFLHDGLGRVVEYQDTLNGGAQTLEYAAGSGLLTSSRDAYGNQAVLTYDPVSFMLTSSELTPVKGGEAIKVQRSYDAHLRLTLVADMQGYTYLNSYKPSGLLNGRSVQHPNQTPYQTLFSYDDYGDLTQLTDPFLPAINPGGVTGCSFFDSATIQDANTYNIARDDFGRVSQVALSGQDLAGLSSYFHFTRTLGYDPVTGLVASDMLGSLPSTLNCGAGNGYVSLASTYLRDNNLRMVGKSVRRSDVASVAASDPAGVADLALTVQSARKARVGKPLRYTFTLRNRSPRKGDISTARDVTLSLMPEGPAAEGWQYIRFPKVCQASGRGLTCNLPSLRGKQSRTLTVLAQPGSLGNIRHVARLAAKVIDPVPGNHALSATANVCQHKTNCAPGSGVTYLADGGNVGTAQFSQRYDPAGHVTSSTRQDFAGSALQESYSFDPLTGYLVGYANNGQSLLQQQINAAIPNYHYSTQAAGADIFGATYEYDLFGNISVVNQYTIFPYSSPDQNGMYRRYTYGNANNPFQLTDLYEQQCPSVVCKNIQGTYQYDVAGNVTQDAFGRGLDYDAHGLLSEITRSDGAQELLIRDGLGQIVQRKATWLAGPVDDYGRAKLVNGTWQIDFIGGTAVIPAGSYNTQPQPNFIEVTDLGGRSVSNVAYGTNPSGFEVIANTAYLPFGVATNLSNPNAGYPNGIDSSGYYPDAVTGEVDGMDVGTGLIMKGGYRAYDPVIGRFLQMDSMSPFGKGGLNGYAYAGNDPIDFDDPTGHYKELKSHRYGPKPPHAHHPSSGGFWQGFASGFKHGVKGFFTRNYHWAKSFGEDIASGNEFGAFKMGFNMAADNYIDAMLGPASSLVFTEFVTTNPSAIFSGKTPFTAQVPAGGNAYQIGYNLGDKAGGYADEGALIIATLVVGDAVGAVADTMSSGSGAADAAVTADSAGSSATDLRVSSSKPVGDDSLSESSGEESTPQRSKSPDIASSRTSSLADSEEFFSFRASFATEYFDPEPGNVEEPAQEESNPARPSRWQRFKSSMKQVEKKVSDFNEKFEPKSSAGKAIANTLDYSKEIYTHLNSSVETVQNYDGSRRKEIQEAGTEKSGSDADGGNSGVQSNKTPYR